MLGRLLALAWKGRLTRLVFCRGSYGTGTASSARKFANSVLPLGGWGLPASAPGAQHL